MNKNIVYIGIAVVVGLFSGWLIFGNIPNNGEAKAGVQVSPEEHDHSGERADEMWTCSMHPQIMRSEPGDCPICGMDLIPAEVGANGLLADQFALSENAMALANIETIVVGESNNTLEGGVVLSGKIEINGDKTAIQPAHFDGRIEKLYITSLGEKVRKGQAIAKVYSPELVAAQQELITAYKLKESQPQLYKAVQAKFKNWKVHGPELDEVVKTGKAKASFTIYSHVSGVVTEIAVSDGAHIMDGKAIFKVSNLNTVWADFDVYENQISQFKKGEQIQVTTNAYPNKVFNAKVSYIDPILNAQTRTVTLRAVLDNKDEIFKPGMFVKGKIGADTMDVESETTIPASAVLWTGKRSLVYVKSDLDKPIFEMREVTIGNRNGESVTIISGLDKGEKIVTNGTFTVDAAAQLQGKKSMMNRKSNKEEVRTNEIEIKVSEAFQNGFQNVVQPYLDMKDAFVASDAGQVSRSAKLTEEQFKNLNTTDSEKAYVAEILKLLNAIHENKIIEDQRTHFVVLNEILVPMAKNIPLSKNLFVQKCPMANSNKGAFWLSEEKEIRNPYYGQEMISCGSIIDDLK
ncbi:efflux RND transporter periplasmic adaptor subunit [Zobellia amurskyensis]|uniref:Efflux RND transporter periplasmic adaptor subunit n=1 Tax=Zobellia amurskyensis TaxID=248905 RepID=A0A7X2ZXQ8_9FLAO|nr:efflux RND transporter periplasmic adaptor subunit [Zobellia amurskyensis]MUH38332.1 efflux RND transporter periplasmic adaptor subunit [Zobellia amurskyensis]